VFVSRTRPSGVLKRHAAPAILIWRDHARKASDRIVKRGPGTGPPRETAVRSLADFVFPPEYDIMSDMSKARQYGFHQALATEEMFVGSLDRYRAAEDDR